MALHDFGTVRAFETDEVVEVSFPRSDQATKALLKSLKGRWDPNRRAWIVVPRFARCDLADIAPRIEAALLESAPPAWRTAVQTLSKIRAVTLRYAISVGAGGVRLELPRGHRHEYLLRKHEGVERDGNSWLIPSVFCADDSIKKALRDAIQDDRAALSKAIDYLEGFSLSGELDLAQGEEAGLGLVPGSVCFADPSFVKKADPSLPSEPVRFYPLEVVSFARDGFEARTKLNFVCGDRGWAALRKRLGEDAPSPLDVRHVKGEWVRKRG